jgi:predicted chitinase
MYTLTPRFITVIKKQPKQSIDLPSDQKKTILPGFPPYYSPYIKSREGNHWEVSIEGETWFLYSPHWLLEAKKIVINAQQLQAIYKFTPPKQINSALATLNDGMERFEINLSKARVAAFLAQLGHESGGLRFTTELASGDAYEGRKDLGNTQSGDGPRYKGRGWIQLTGRHNYRQAGKAIGVDLESFPTLAASDNYMGLIAGWFWSSRNLNLWADRGDFLTITRRINGGLNGLSDRIQYWDRAKKVLGVEE